MRFTALTLPVALGALLGATPATAYLAENGLVVEPRGQDFYIPYRGESGAPAFWCAAGDYAQKQLGLSQTTPLYRTTEPPRRSGQGIGFSMSPGKAASGTGLATVGNQGGGISVGAARNLCDAVRLGDR